MRHSRCRWTLAAREKNRESVAADVSQSGRQASTLPSLCRYVFLDRRHRRVERARVLGPGSFRLCLQEDAAAARAARPPLRILSPTRGPAFRPLPFGRISTASAVWLKGAAGMDSPTGSKIFSTSIAKTALSTGLRPTPARALGSWRTKGGEARRVPAQLNTYEAAGSHQFASIRDIRLESYQQARRAASSRCGRRDIRR